MPIDINHLLNMVKQSAQPDMDAGSQAMALAAQQAKPVGGTPLPKAIKPEEDKSGQEEGKMMETMNKLEEKHRKEVEKKDNELQALKHQLDMEQLDRKRMVGEHSMEQKQKAQMDQLKQQRDELDRYKAEIDRQAMEREKEFERKSLEAQKSMEQEHTNQQTMQQAEQISHQAELDKQTAEQRVAVAEEKAKAMMEISQQQANDYIKTTERAKQTTDKYFADREAQMKANSPVISTALQNQMDSAFKAVGRLGAVRNKINAIPRPGTPPQIKMASIEFYNDEPEPEKQDNLIPAVVDSEIVIPMPSSVPVVKSARIVTGVSNEYAEAQKQDRERVNNKILDYGANTYLGGNFSNTAEGKGVQSAVAEGQALMSDHMGNSYDAQMQRDVSDAAMKRAREQANNNRKSKNEAERADAFRFGELNRRVWSSDFMNGNWGGKSESARDAIVNQYRDQVKARQEAEDWASKGWFGKGVHYLGQAVASPWNATKWVGKNIVGSVADDLINGGKGFYDMAKTHWNAGKYNLGYNYASQANTDAGRSVGGSLLQFVSGVGNAALMATGAGAAANAARAGFAAARGAGSGLARATWQGVRNIGTNAWDAVRHPILHAKNAPRGWYNSRPMTVAGMTGVGASVAGPLTGMYGHNNAEMAAGNAMNRYDQQQYQQYGQQQYGQPQYGQMGKAASTAQQPEGTKVVGEAYGAPIRQITDPSLFGPASMTSFRPGEGMHYVGDAYGMPIYKSRSTPVQQPGAQQQAPAPENPAPKTDPKDREYTPDDPYRYEGVTNRGTNVVNDYNTGYDHNLIGNTNWKDSIYENTRSGRLAKTVNPFLKMLTGVDLMKRNEAVEKGMWKPEVLSPQARMLAAMDMRSDQRFNMDRVRNPFGQMIQASWPHYGSAPYYNMIHHGPSFDMGMF